MTINFDDYNCISDKELISIDKNGICYKDGFISFNECAVNYYNLNGGNGKCIGERDISTLSFDLYTRPKITSIVFLSKNALYELLSKNSAVNRFHRLQYKLNEYGFTTRDIS